MPPKKKRVLGRGMAELVDGSFSSMIEPAAEPARSASQPTPAPEPPGSAKEPATTSPAQPEPVARHVRTPSPRQPMLPSRESETHTTIPPASSTAPSPEPAAPAPPASPRPFDVISVSSGKGGTGKSVLTSNLGVLLAPGTRVTILDADLGLANIHILFNLMPRYNASHVITGERTLDEVIIQGPRGLGIIPGGSGIPELASLTEGRFSSLVNGISALDRTTDLLLIDTPSGIDRQSLTFLLASDQVLVVTTEDVTAMTDAYAVIKTVMTRRPDATVTLVVNQARSYADGLETFHKVSHVARKFLGRELTLGGVVPFDEMVERSVAERLPVALSHPDCPASRAMASVASRIGSFHSRSQRAAQPFTARLKRLLSSPAPR